MTRSPRHTEQPQGNDNHAALAQLLEHIQQQRDRQCSSIHAEAEAECHRLLSAARAQAASLLRTARRRERAAEHARLQEAHTQQRGSVRKVWLRLRSEWANRGLESLEQTLRQLWREDPEARRRWLERALGEAARVLPGKRWVLEHPRDLEPGELDRAISTLCPGVTLELLPSDGLVAGYRVTSGNAAIDLSPSGLLARRSRIAGLLLAQQSLAPPELES